MQSTLNSVIIVVVLLLTLFYITGVDRYNFRDMHIQKPWVLYLSVFIVMYAIINVFKDGYEGFEDENQNQDENQEQPSLLNFNDFMKKHYALEPKPNVKRYVSFRTKIDDVYYYLIISSNIESKLNVYQKKQLGANIVIMPRMCKIGDQYIRPVLIREDVLEGMHSNHINSMNEQVETEIKLQKVEQQEQIEKAVQGSETEFTGLDDLTAIIEAKKNIEGFGGVELTKKTLHYPRFVHHFIVDVQNDNTYNIKGMFQKQFETLESINSSVEFTINAMKSLMTTPKKPVDKIPANLDDKIFVCATDVIKSNKPYSLLHAETYAPILEDLGDKEDKEDKDNAPQNDDGLNSLIGSDSSKMMGKVGLYFVYDDKKYYLTKLDDFKPITDQTKEKIMYPIGMKPSEYIKPETMDLESPDYSLGSKLEFEVIVSNLQPLNL